MRYFRRRTETTVLTSTSSFILISENKVHLSDSFHLIASDTIAGTLGPFPAKPSNGYLTYVTLQLQTHREILLPSDETLEKNNVIKLPNDEDPPVFVQLVEKELGLRRFPRCDVSFPE